jgi:hypothetical protein
MRRRVVGVFAGAAASPKSADHSIFYVIELPSHNKCRVATRRVVCGVRFLCPFDRSITVFVGDILRLFHRARRRLVMQLRIERLVGCRRGSRTTRTGARHLLLELSNLRCAWSAQRSHIATE